MNLDESLQLMGMQDESLTKRRSNNEEHKCDNTTRV